MLTRQISFAVATGAVIIAIIYLPATPWVRAFLALGSLYVITSAFTLAKCVRDAQDDSSVVNRLDQARLERLLAEFDPYQQQVPNLGHTTSSTGPAPSNGPAPTNPAAAYHPMAHAG